VTNPENPQRPVIVTQQDAVAALAAWISDPATRPEDVDEVVAEMCRRRREQQ
jgi:hypothetical protein